MESMMKRLNFGSDGKLTGVDGSIIRGTEKKSLELKTSASLDFLKEEKIEEIFDDSYWSLFRGNEKLKPLTFSNGKTQEDVVREIVELAKKGRKVIFLHGVCGTGKSAIALNIARKLGRTSIVVPIKSLQKQYEEDYMKSHYLLKQNGKKMRIAMITGRDNHDSIIKPGTSCADPYLPDTVRISEKNFSHLKQFYLDNPFISNRVVPLTKDLKRISIAPANPYWSPILPADVDLKMLKDAKRINYKGVNGRDYIFYHRRRGCSYYDQYLAYIHADVIIFNSAKYLAEFSIGRKPQTEVEIIDECDEFLDNLSNQVELNLTRLDGALRILNVEDNVKESIKQILSIINAEETRAGALGVNEEKVFHISETRIGEILDLISENSELQSEIAVDEMNYANTALEASESFKDAMSETYLTYRKEEDNLYAMLVTTNLAKKFKSIVDGNKTLVLMSGTLHSAEVLKNIFGVTDYEIVEAEALQQGAIEIFRTGKEFDCKYSNFSSEKYSRRDYLNALSEVVSKAERPTLVHVNAFSDLPSNGEESLGLVSKEKLIDMQKEDKTGKLVSIFKHGLNDLLFTTKCSRGIDFPGDICKSVVFTKYPNPNVKGTFWKILQKTHSTYYWDVYRDKAKREFLQRLYRAIRSKDDHVYVLSPDKRVLDAVRELQTENY